MWLDTKVAKAVVESLLHSRWFGEQEQNVKRKGHAAPYKP